MDNNITSHDMQGPGYLIVTTIGFIFGWIKDLNIHQLLQDGSLLISICAGLMAIRHYYLQNKKK